MRTKQILLDNAYVAWAEAIELCNELLDGKATINNQKRFVSALHNSIELFLKQIMLDENNHNIAKLPKVDSIETSELSLKYYQSNDLNKFFKELSNEQRQLFHSIAFNEFYNRNHIDFSINQSYFKECLKKLNNLRNDEMHFYIDKHNFLSEENFIMLHNFMIKFREYLVFKKVIYNNYKAFDNDIHFTELKEFSYFESLWENPIRKMLSGLLDDSLEYAKYGNSFELAVAIWKNHPHISNSFNELWSVIENMIKFGMIEYEFTESENEFIIKTMK